MCARVFLCEFMHACVSMCVFMRVCVHARVCSFMHMNVCVFIHMYVCVCVFMYVSVYFHASVCIHVCVCLLSCGSPHWCACAVQPALTVPTLLMWPPGPSLLPSCGCEMTMPVHKSVQQEAQVTALPPGSLCCMPLSSLVLLTAPESCFPSFS